MKDRYNTRGLQKEISKKLSKSDMWLVLRMDKEGVHFHAPSEDHMALFAIFFDQRRDLLQAVNEIIEKAPPHGEADN